MARTKRPRIKLPLWLRAITTAIIVIGAIAALAYLYLVSGEILLRWAAAIVALLVAGQIITLVNGLTGSFGLYMLGSRRGIGFIERLSKRSPAFWRGMAEWGLVVGFGILAWPLFRRYISKKMFALGMASLALMLLFFPYNIGAGIQFINIPQITSRLAIPSYTPGIVPVVNPFVDGAALLGGFMLYIFAAIGEYTFQIFYTIATVLISTTTSHPNYAPLAQLIPGIAPLIPGITIPLAAGILSLLVVLVIHEFSHGVLGRMAKVKLKSVGLVIVGIIPMGAFVEPDEKMVGKLSEGAQNKIFAAGVASNMLASVIFFVLWTLFSALVYQQLLTTQVVVVATVPGTPAANVIPVGAIVTSWNGYPILNISSFSVAAVKDTPGATVVVGTNKGTFSLVANATGKVGVEVEQITTPASQGTAYTISNFIYTFFGLSFLLNFLIAVVNLLPLPGFDGWRIFQTKMSKRTLNIITLVVVIFFLANLLPWAFVI